MDDPTIITLSSIPPRFAHLGPTLQSLLAQDMPAAQVILQVPHRYRRFPDWDGRLPDLPKGVTLNRCEHDFGPATKLLPALQAFAGQQVDILFCDDDLYYLPDWHRRFKAQRRLHPRAALAEIAHNLPDLARVRQPRMQRWTRTDLAQYLDGLRADPTRPPLPDPPPLIRHSGFADILEGWGGVMVRPEFFDARVFEIPPHLWMVDDPWLSGHLALRGVPIWVNAQSLPPLRRRNVGHDIAPLFYEVFDGQTRQQSDAACIEHYRRMYGLWRPPSALRRFFRRLLPHTLRAAVQRLVQGAR